MKWTPIFLILVSGCGIATKIRQAKELEEAQDLVTRIQVGVPNLIHQNHHISIQFETPPEFTFELPKFPTDVLGIHTVDIPLEYKSIQVPYPISYTVVSSEDSPQFPLSEGYTWSYNTEANSTKTTARFLFFFPVNKKSQDTTQDSLSIKIGAPHVRDAHTEYTATVIHKDVEQKVRLMGLDGETMYWNGTQWKSFITITAPMDEHVYAAKAIKCSLAIPGFETCTCYAAPEGAVFAPPGPIECLPFDQTTQVDHKKTKSAGFWFLLSAGTVLIPDKQKTKTSYAFKLGRVDNISPSPRDTDVFWKALHPSKTLSTPEWISIAKRLSKQHTWDMEVAAALYLANTDDDRNKALLKLLEHHSDRQELIYLAPKGMLRTQLEADLNIDVETSFTKQILRRRQRFKTEKNPHAVLEGVTLSLFDPQQDAVLLDYLSGDTRSHLCVALAKVLPEPTRKAWWENSDIGTGTLNLEHYSLESKLGLVPTDPLLEAVIPALMRETFADNAIPDIERAVKKHPVSITAAQLILNHIRFDSIRLKVLSTLLQGLPEKNRERLLASFTFEKEAAAKILGVPAP